MAFDSRWIDGGIVSLIVLIVFRRWYRGRYFRRLNERTLALCERWNDIISGKIPAASWRLNAFDCQIVEGMLLDSIEMADAQMLPELLYCLRNSGLLDLRIHESRRLTRVAAARCFGFSGAQSGP